MNRTNHHSLVSKAAVAIAVTVILGAGGLVGCSATHDHLAAGSAAVGAMDMTHDGEFTSKQLGLYTAMSHLWAEHMEWTYATVVAFAEESPSLNPTLNRLLQNQVDIGDAIKPLYGADAGDQLTVLLKEHITDAVPVLTAAKAGDSADLETAVADWYANAVEIGDFLAGANPNWNKAEMEEMMKLHITQTIAYASDALAGDYDKAIADYGIAEQHMNEMSDMLSAGLIKQFPDQFE